MSVSKFPSKILKEDIPQIFYYLSDKKINVDTGIFSDKVFIEHSEIELNEENSKICKLIGKNKISKENLILSFSMYFNSLEKKMDNNINNKTFQNIKKQDAYNDLKILFETDEGRQELLNEINSDINNIRNFIEIEKEKSKYSHSLVMSILIFIILNTEYIIKSINRKNLIFLNEKKEIITLDFQELIISLYNKTFELYTREINRIEKINKILNAIEKSFLDYKNLKGMSNAIKKFGNFIELNPKINLGYQFKENRNLSFFIFYHQNFLYKIINEELFTHMSNLRYYSLFKKFSNSEFILMQNLNSLTYKKILVKKRYDINNKSNKIQINYQEDAKVCKIQHNINSKIFSKIVPSIIDGDIEIKEMQTNQSVLNTKVELKNIPFDNILKTFCHILSKYSITLMEEKKPEFTSENIKKPIVQTFITKLYDKKLIEMAYKGTTILDLNNSNNKLEINLENLIKNGCNVNSTDKNGCTPLTLASKKLHSDFIKSFLELVKDNKKCENFEPNIPDANGCTPLHAALYSILSRSIHVSNDNELSSKNSNINANNKTQKMNLFFAKKMVQKFDFGKKLGNINHGHLTIKRLLKYSKINPNLTDNKNNTPLHIAVEIGDIKIIEILLERSNFIIDTDITNYNGKKAIEITNNKEIIKKINHYIENKFAVTLPIDYILDPKKFIKNAPNLKQSLKFITKTIKKI
ncbi:ankyrin repeat domain-containing protein [Silvanigrella sp.]|jgi:ankyrin repeat protein|uniref:ankyrin repeat domain-containing protein n=1 Tax=Silvanigrella sp. TaxID=2024976 RepID=UPI0037C82080